MFEDPYLGDVVSKTSYDQIYDEHVFLFSALSVQFLFGLHGMELIDVLPQNTWWLHALCACSSRHLPNQVLC